MTDTVPLSIPSLSCLVPSASYSYLSLSCPSQSSSFQSSDQLLRLAIRLAALSFIRRSLGMGRRSALTPHDAFASTPNPFLLLSSGMVSYSPPYPPRGGGDFVSTSCAPVWSLIVGSLRSPTRFAHRSVFVVSGFELLVCVGLCRLPNIFLDFLFSSALEVKNG